MTDVVVVGGGLAGLAAAGEALSRGLSATLVSKSPGGSLPLCFSGLDVLGRDPEGRAVEDPFRGAAELARARPDHPYALAGPSALERGAGLLAELLGTDDPLPGAPNRPLLTLMGRTRRACWAPGAMTRIPLDGETFVVAGFEPWPGLSPELVAGGLSLERPGARARTVRLRALMDLGTAPEPAAMAAALDLPEVREAVAAELAGAAAGADLVVFPAVVGLRRHAEAAAHLAGLLGAEIAEIATPLPSVAGVRLAAALTEALTARGLAIVSGFGASALRIGGGRVESVEVAAPGGTETVSGRWFVLATGGLVGGGLRDLGGRLVEPLADLPVRVPDGEPFGPSLASPHPIQLAGLPVDSSMRPLGPDGRPAAGNLRAAGAIVAGADRVREMSRGGVDLATAVAAVRSLDR